MHFQSWRNLWYQQFEQFTHSEARIASSLGQGFYTIGPCGEELLGGIALNLRPTDSSALHYRHVATSVTRQLVSGKTVFDIALSRARGYVCSSLDPVTGGKHCAIGGSAYDFLVTSTLASQAPPAVGRALSIPLSNRLLPSAEQHGHVHGVRKKKMFPADAISYVSFGEGSVNNAHFLSALNLAKYSQHRGVKVRARATASTADCWLVGADCWQCSASGTALTKCYSILL